MYSIKHLKNFLSKPIYCKNDYKGYEKGHFYTLYDIDNDVVFVNEEINDNDGYEYLTDYEISNDEEFINVNIKPPLDIVDSKNLSDWEIRMNVVTFVFSYPTRDDDEFSHYFELITKPDLRKRKIRKLLK